MSLVEELQRVAQAGKDRDPAWYRAHRRLSFPLTRVALRAGVTANQASAAMMVAGAAGAALIAGPGRVAAVAGFALLYAAFLLDKIDGEVARCRGTQSLRGIVLDRLHHRVIEPLVFVAAGLHELARSGSAAGVIAGLAVVVLANVVEEHQQLAPYVLWKHLRDTRRRLPPVPAPRPGLARLRRLLRPLKGFRMLIVALPSLAVAYAAESHTAAPLVTGYLVLSAAALAAYLAFQCVDLYLEQVDVEARTVLRTLREAAARSEEEPLR